MAPLLVSLRVLNIVLRFMNRGLMEDWASGSAVWTIRTPDKKPPNDHEHKTVWPKSPPGARPRESIGRRVDELSLSKAFDLFPKRVDEILKKLNLPVEVVGQKRTADAKVELRDVRSAKKS